MLSSLPRVSQVSRLTSAIVLTLFSALSLSVASSAQGTTGQNATGTKPFWTYLKAREVISPSSGNLMVQIPLLHLPGRDGHDLNLSYTYNSAGHMNIDVIPGSPPGPNNNGPYVILQWQYKNPWTLSIPYLSTPGIGNLIPNTTPGLYCIGGSAITADGASYSFGMADWGCQQGGNYSEYNYLDNPIAADDSLAGVIFDGTAPLGPTAYFPNGHRLIAAATPQNTTAFEDVDANGNMISYQGGPDGASITDTVGRSISASQSGVTYKNSQGTPESITITWGKSPAATSTITPPPPTGSGLSLVQTSCSNCNEWVPTAFNDSQLGISSIVYPDGTSYSFQYDALGNLIKVGYPGGGYTRYEYAPFNRSYFMNSPTLPTTVTGQQYQIIAKHTCSDEDIPVKTTVISPGNTCTVAELTTTYAPTAQGAYNITNVVTEPADSSSGSTTNTTTTYNFGQVTPSSSFPINSGAETYVTDWAPVELSHTITDSHGNTLETVVNTYESDAIHIKDRKTTRLYGGSTDEGWTNVSTALKYNGVAIPGAGGQTPYQVWTVQSYGVTDLATGKVLKTENYTYNTPAFDPAQAYFASLKTAETIVDGVSGTTYKMSYGYDATTPTSSGVSTQHLSVGSVRGNMTSSLAWSSVDNAYIGTTHTFDDTGNILTSTDALGLTTTYSYTDAYADSTCLVSDGGPTAAYPTTVRNALGQSGSVIYNSCTGTKASTKDANSAVTSYLYYFTDQPKSVSLPDGGQVSFCYGNVGPCTSPSSDTGVRNFTLTTQLMSPDPSVTTEEDYDGLQRTVSKKVMSDPCKLENDTTYDSMERVLTTTYPYYAIIVGTACPKNTPPTLTTRLYNGLGELTSRQVQGSTAITWSYSGQSATETDENGNQKVRTLDGAGRLITVLEPNTSATLVNETDYAYDAMNNLLQVDQWGGAKGSTGDRQRVFVYDTLSRLTSSSNPEAGTITYGYDKDNNPVSETDARGITTSRSFDTLNRLTQTLYSDGTPTECFYYDAPDNGDNINYSSINSYPIGRLTAEWTQVGACNGFGLPGSGTALTLRLIGGAVGSSGVQGYDAVGRLVSDLQCPSQPCVTPYATQYNFDLGGQLDTQTAYGTPVGALALSYSHDSGGRQPTVTSSWTDSKHPTTLSSVTGWSGCGLLGEQIGLVSSSAAVTMARAYDNHCRPVSESDSAPAVSASPAVQASATLNIAMSEQHTTATGTPSTASFVFSENVGGDQYSTACSCYETGLFTVLVDVGMAGQVGYVAQDGTASTPTSIASGLVTSINTNSSSLVTATSSGPTVFITSKADGQAVNYPLLVQGSITNPNFTTPSFSASASGPNMVGGTNGSGTTVYDSGTSAITIGSLAPVSIAWTNSDTATTIATRLAAAVNTSDGATVTATASGPQITVKAVVGGTAGNLSVQSGVTYNTTYFSSSSVTMSGATAMAGGTNAVAAQSAGVIYQYSSGVWQANGNLASITDSILGTQTFGYADHLNRLTSATFNGAKGNFTLSMSYDAFGNRQTESVSGTSSLSFTQPATASYSGASMLNGNMLRAAYNNRTDGQNYDASGNFLGNQFTPAFVYDAGSRLKSSGGVCYLYNADGMRTAKGTTYVNGACSGITAQYILGAGGEQLTELDGSGNWKHTNAFAGGKLLATYDAVGIHFHINDWLGTARMQVGPNGAIDETCISLPFGDGLTCSGPGVDATEHHFTGKEHDTESGLDYFGARYYTSGSGRWMSPDWAAKNQPVPYAKLDNPQSLDLYAYVENNPITMADADGHFGGSPIRCNNPYGCIDDDNTESILNGGKEASREFAAYNNLQSTKEIQNKTQRIEAANERIAKQHILDFAKRHGSSNLYLHPTCTATCSYDLIGNDSTKFFVWEHNTQKVGDNFKAADNDYVSPGAGQEGWFGPDNIGGQKLDSYRFFTISPVTSDGKYDPNAQIPVLIKERGQMIEYEHLYSEGKATYINGEGPPD